jgi:Ca2+:H+ antiporter
MDLLRRIGVLNVLLVFVPLAIGLRLADASPTWVFVASSVAIIPLAGLMGRSTEMIAHRMGPGIGGLMNASFGNAAELIIAFFALKDGYTEIVKASLTGSILGNILLVLGASFLAGGVRYRRQVFNRTAAGMAATLLALAAVGLLVPALFHAHLIIHHEAADEQGVSLEIAIVLFVSYILMLLFSLKTHKHLYSPEDHAAPNVERLSESHAADHSPLTTHHSPPTTQHSESQPPPPDPSDPANVGHGHAAHVEDHWPQWLAITVLVAATTCVALMSELLVGAIEHASQTFGWTELFVGVFVVAVVGNAAEHSTAILVARKNQMDLSFQIAVGSGLQIALFVAPLLVFISYLPGFPQLNLVFTMLEVVAVLASVLIVGLVAHDGESNWLEGLLLLAVYLILAIAFFHLPDPHDAETPAAPAAPLPAIEEAAATLPDPGPQMSVDQRRSAFPSPTSAFATLYARNNSSPITARCPARPTGRSHRDPITLSLPCLHVQRLTLGV